MNAAEKTTSPSFSLKVPASQPVSAAEPAAPEQPFPSPCPGTNPLLSRWAFLLYGILATAGTVAWFPDLTG